MRRPNVLMIVLDCGRADRLLDPARTARTPHIDALRQRGATFSHVIAETSATTPCFAGLLTGCDSARHRVFGLGGYPLSPHVSTLGEYLQRGGWHPVAEVTGPLLAASGLSRGFEHYRYRVALEHLHQPWGRALVQRVASGALPEPWFLLVHLWELHTPRVVRPGFDGPAFGADRFDRALSSLDQALEPLLRAAGADALVLLTADHGEKTVAEPYLPGSSVHRAAALYAGFRAPVLGVRNAALLIGPAVMQELRRRFRSRLESFSPGAPAAADAAATVGVVDFVRLLRLSPWIRPATWRGWRPSRGWTDVLAVTSALNADEAARRVAQLVAAVGEERLFGLFVRMWVSQFRKQLHEGHVLHVYDHLVRVPLIVSGPGIPAGFISAVPLRQIDILPTLLDLLELDPPHDIAGRSCAALLHGAAPHEQPALLSVRGQPRDIRLLGIRTPQYKYTRGLCSSDVPAELYDLHSDPAERRNIASERPDVCAMLESELIARTSAQSTDRAPGAVEPAVDLPLPQRVELEQRLRELGYLE